MSMMAKWALPARTSSSRKRFMYVPANGYVPAEARQYPRKNDSLLQPAPVPVAPHASTPTAKLPMTHEFRWIR